MIIKRLHITKWIEKDFECTKWIEMSKEKMMTEKKLIEEWGSIVVSFV